MKQRFNITKLLIGMRAVDTGDGDTDKVSGASFRCQETQNLILDVNLTPSEPVNKL